MQKKLITLTGPSLTGKSHLSQLLQDKSGARELVSSTTRPMRAGEVNGQHYHFLDMKTFEAMEARGEFIESARFGGHAYGASRQAAEQVFSHGVPAILVCEPNGTRNIHAYAQTAGWECLRVFVDNPVSVLAERFLERFSGDAKADPKHYAKRLAEMFTTEREEWVLPARDGRAAYDLILDAFGDSSQEQAIQSIMDKAGLSAQPSVRRLGPR